MTLITKIMLEQAIVIAKIEIIVITETALLLLFAIKNLLAIKNSYFFLDKDKYPIALPIVRNNNNINKAKIKISAKYAVEVS